MAGLAKLSEIVNDICQIMCYNIFRKVSPGNAFFISRRRIIAFNVNNMEIIQGIVEAAIQEKAPLILQVSAGARKYAKHIYLTKLVEAAVEDTGLPICLHLDHGADFEICKDCVDGGFTSVMIDGSKYPFEENIELTKRVVDYAHSKGVVVEAELGKLAGVEDAVKVAWKTPLKLLPKTPPTRIRIRP